MDKNILFVVLPCYNEGENIAALVQAWKQQEAGLAERSVALRLLVVNDGSSDNTQFVGSRLAQENSNVQMISHEKNKGLGEVLNTGINFVLGEEDIKYLCIMDGDMTQHPSYIHAMLDKMERMQLDCVIASRYRKGSKVEGLSFYRKILSYGARVVYTLKLGVPGVRDYTCGYRLYKVSALRVLAERYKGRILKESSFACMLELLGYLYQEGFKMGEVPFVLKYQLKKGQSKMNVMRTIRRSLNVLGRV